MAHPPRSTLVSRHIAAPRAAVYAALLDPELVRQWKVPDDMGCVVHQWEGIPGGCFRVSLTYNRPEGVGKTSAHTDTYAGRFISLVPDTQVVEAMAFETQDPAMGGEMVVTFSLSDAGEGTEIVASHVPVPEGISLEDNALGYKMALANLARLLEVG